MESNKLKALMVEEEMNADKLVETLEHQEGLRMSKSAFYRKLKGASDFTRTEIRGIARVLKMTDEQILIIFFNSKVS